MLHAVVRTLCAASLLASGPALARVSIERISVSSDGVQAQLPSLPVSITDDGRRAAFTSADLTLAPGYDGSADFAHLPYVRDVLLGTTTLVWAPEPGGPFPGPATVPSLGGLAFFLSRATDIAPVLDPTLATERLYARDLDSGEVSLQLDSHCYRGITAFTAARDGRHVGITAAECSVTGPGGDIHGTSAWLLDRSSGAVTLLSRDGDGNAAEAGHRIGLGSDGRFAVFWSAAAIDGLGGGPDSKLYVFDRADGSIERVALPDCNQYVSTFAAISDDGDVVAFRTRCMLVAGDTAPTEDVYVYTRSSAQPERVSLAPDGSEFATSTTSAAMSRDGDRIAWLNDGRVYVHDRSRGARLRVSSGAHGASGVVLSPGGRWLLAVLDDASIDGDSNGVRDVVRIDLQDLYTVHRDGFEPAP